MGEFSASQFVAARNERVARAQTTDLLLSFFFSLEAISLLVFSGSASVSVRKLCGIKL